MHLPPLDVVVYPMTTVGFGRSASRSARSSLATSIVPLSSSTLSLPSTPTADVPGIQKALQGVFRSSKITVQQTERLPGRLHQVYRAKLADGTSLVLKFLPHVSCRALRHEKHSLGTELKTLQYIHEYGQAQLPVPEVYQYQRHGDVLRSPFLLMSYIEGVKLSEVLYHISAGERDTIDRTLGSYMRKMIMLNAQQFGLAHKVFAGKGSHSWRQAFRALLESALRDCEDMLITLPYDSIRCYVEHHIHTLDEVQFPCLVAMNMCEPESVLVHPQTKQVTGLVGFSNVIWGDPLMNDCIANGSNAFFEGYGERPRRAGPPHVRIML